MTLISAPDLENVKVNQQAKYIGQRSFSSKVIVKHPTDFSIPGPVVGKRQIATKTADMFTDLTGSKSY